MTTSDEIQNAEDQEEATAAHQTVSPRIDISFTLTTTKPDAPQVVGDRVPHRYLRPAPPSGIKPDENLVFEGHSSVSGRNGIYSVVISSSAPVVRIPLVIDKDDDTRSILEMARDALDALGITDVIVL